MAAPPRACGWPMARPHHHLSPAEERQGAGGVGRRRWPEPRPAPPQPPEQPRHASGQVPGSSLGAARSAAGAPLAFSPRPRGAEKPREEAPWWRWRWGWWWSWWRSRRRRWRPGLPAMEPPEPGRWWGRLLLGRLRDACHRRLLLPRRCCPSLAKRQGRLLAAALTCCCCCTVLAWCALSAFQNHHHHQQLLRPDQEEPSVTVLLWWPPFGHSRGLGACPPGFGLGACRLTTNRSRLQEAQAVLFHHRDLVLQGLEEMPTVRSPGQRWVWMNFESPSHSQGLRELRGIFNWTMSYRVDSDVFVPYGYLRPKQAPDARLALPRKTKLVAWVISNWNEDHARVRYYRQLQKYLPIDVYGSQGLDLNGSSVVEVVSQYKFYLAFENSQHQDYITEKLWRNALESWAVPIVLGPPRSNYELFIPSDSFIHIDDFSGPLQLALYLKFLDKNKNRYRRYFAWRKHYDVQVTSFWAEHCCRVCDAVRTAGGQRKTVQNLANWFEH
ncbi:hypothetical protein JRQ81_019605 [Phrynocephalus forsythii]|uniref:Fucosyltransferase n=1 Tax=Phrynocephalus forsythii TaxID=171643 RepID=A0A9Q1AY50_9SAUR|nr:hypothetical protein JRQ81_019605 [Phrynocephalus forsythii]